MPNLTGSNGDSPKIGAEVGSGEATSHEGRLASLTLVPHAPQPLTMKGVKSDQEVRWCPGCGDYAILAAFQAFLPNSTSRERTSSSSPASAVRLGCRTT